MASYASSGDESVSRSKKLKRHYVHRRTMPWEEDLTHEFKGHRNLQVEEIPDTAYELSGNRLKRTRQPVSRTLNGFLNNREGGTVYLGVLDDGIVRGLHLTQFQKDHTRENLRNLLSRYTPPVEDHRYSIKFVPVVEVEGLSTEEVAARVNFDSRKTVTEKERLRPHMLQAASSCWCDNEATARHSHHQLPPRYVVEITILPWNPADSRNRYPVGKLRVHPLHQDETGEVRRRTHASTATVPLNEVAEYSRSLVASLYQHKLVRLKQQLAELIITDSSDSTADSGASDRSSSNGVPAE